MSGQKPAQLTAPVPTLNEFRKQLGMGKRRAIQIIKIAVDEHLQKRMIKSLV